MVVRSVSLSSYRNVKSASVSFDEGVNILVGDNAQGKTNLLESIYLFALGKSFRGAKESELIRFDDPMAEVKLNFTASGRDQQAIIRYGGGKRVAELNGVRLSRMSEMVGNFRAVLFCPEHLGLVKEGPAVRRNYMDVAISQFKPVYLRALQRYSVALRERNKLLKMADDNPKFFRDTIELYSAEMAEQAAVIMPWRATFCESMHMITTVIFQEMSGLKKENPALSYQTSLGLDSQNCHDPDTIRRLMMTALTHNLAREQAAGMTLYGPHRDDIDIKLNRRPARLYASQGQQRSLALAMKLAEGDISCARGDDMPVYLLDDVLSELDAGRRQYLTREFKGRQVIITTCEREVFPGEANVIDVSAGQFDRR